MRKLWSSSATPAVLAHRQRRAAGKHKNNAPRPQPVPQAPTSWARIRQLNIHYVLMLSLLFAVLLFFPFATHASLFDKYYDQALNELPSAPVPPAVTDYVIGEMERWGTDGIRLDDVDIDAARRGQLDTLCRGKVDMHGRPMALILAAGTDNCYGLQNSILSLVEQEREVQVLGDDLLALSNGGELASADEPGRPGGLGERSLTFRHLWTGSGMTITPWKTTLQPYMDRIDAALAADGNRDAVLQRFHFGYFRDQRERDPDLAPYGTQTEDALSALATALGITGDTTKTGAFSLPPLATENMAVWARGDDIGLMEVWPLVFHRPFIEPAFVYPQKVDGGDRLAYPYSYAGMLAPPDDAPFTSPLCSRSAARDGYLCRPLTSNITCPPGSDSGAITLTQCQVQEHRSPGPEVCSGAVVLFRNHGQSLADINPTTDTPAPNALCSPESSILYRDQVATHACYIGQCIAQSLSGHTLMPGRNPVLSLEPTDPFLGAARADPRLGQLFEMHATAQPASLPQYLGEQIVRDFDRLMCQQNGLFPRPLVGLCTYSDSRRTDSPLKTLAEQIGSTQAELTTLTDDQTWHLSLAAAVGERLAVEQSIAVFRTMGRTFAQMIQDVGDLLGELANAPITQDACPWTGPISSSSSP